MKRRRVNGVEINGVEIDGWRGGRRDDQHKFRTGFATEYRATRSELRLHVQASLAGGCTRVWIRTGSSNVALASDLDTFAALVDDLDCPIELISTDGDRSVPSEVRAATVATICASANVTRWYSQNYNDDGRAHPKLRPYPIGLDLHTVRSPHLDTPSKILEAMRAALAAAPRTKELKIYCDVKARGTDRFGGHRRLVVELLNAAPHGVVQEARVTVEAAWREYARHQFVVCPPGNGRDTHRCWEVLALGSIPIVVSSRLDALYAPLPVIILDDWMDMCDPSRLEGWKTQAAAKRGNVDPFRAAR